MSLVIHPDPQEPAGGFAFLELPEGSLPKGEVTVAVFDAFGERWLAGSDQPGARIEIGNANWQADRVDFGPYEVHRHDGADWVRIGPEIVNKLEEYVPLKLFLAGQGFDLSWPDTIPPRAGAAGLGALQPVARSPVAPVETPVLQPEDALPEPAPDDSLTPPPETAQRRFGSLLVPLLIMILVAGALIWAFWPEDAAQDVAVTHAPAAPDAPCGFAALSALGSFAAVLDGMQTCGADVSPETALRLIEDAARRDDVRALDLFGALYDEAVLETPVETVIGLSFDDDPAQAAEYYHRAAQGGSDRAMARLRIVCAVLSGSDATLAKGAFDDFCGM